MLSYKSLFALLSFFAAVFSLAAQQNTIVLPANTPLYKTPDPKQNPIIILFEEKELQLGETKNARYTSGALLLPLKFHQVALPGAGIFWAAPGLEYKEAGKDQPALHPRKNFPLRNRGIGLMFLALICAVIYFSGRLPKIRNVLPYAGIFLFCIGLTCFAIGQSGNIIQGQADDPFYFQAARDILDGKFTGPWYYTIGFPLFYVPFILLQKANTFDEFYYLFLLFNAFCISPASLCFVFAFFKKTTNIKTASIALFTCILLMIFWQSRYFAVIALTCPWMPDRLKTLCGQWNFTVPVTDHLTIAGLIIAALLALSFVIEYIIYRKRDDKDEARNVLSYVIYSILFVILWIEPTAYGVFALSLLAFFSIIKNILQNNKELCKDEI